jgi:hypothetical protein
MTKNRTSRGIVFVVALALAVGVAASCYSDTTGPRFVPPDATTQDTTHKNQG